jgi:energy-coupling factor transport system substrate-specific component
MSWQATTLAAVALLLVAGFGWYERSGPSSRTVALVAALAALAVAGRLVLTPLPNVVATTDIAFITGLALGAAPGFAVGALAAPISNIWLGQGPWTVWEMAGWGMAGLAGAAFGALLGREPRRLALAAACAAVGLVYGLLLDFSFMVGYGGEVSVDRYVAVSAAGLPFNIAHATGNFAIALAAGPALVRMISRYRRRLEFTWHPAGALPAALLAIALASGALGGAERASAAPAGEARSWLAGTQNADGGFAATPGGESSVAMTGWAALGLEAAGRNPLDVRRGGPSAVGYLRANADRISSIGDLERTILALEAAGVDSRRFAGRDLVAELADRRDADGSYSDQVNLTAFALLAMRSAGVDDNGRTARWLRRAQNADGGWGYRSDAPSDADSTGAALQALALGAGGEALERGTRYLRETQRPDGGWSLAGGATNSQSTAWAIQGIVAAGGSTGALNDGLRYLAARQAGDGHYAYSPASDQTPVWVTSQALLAVTRSPFPLDPVERAPRDDPARKDNGGTPAGGASTGNAAGGRHQTGRGTGASDAGNGASGRGGDAGRAGPGQGVEAQAGSGSSRARGAEAPDLVAAAPAAAGGADDASPVVPVLAGLGGLVLVLGAGWAWYRRTLP